MGKSGNLKDVEQQYNHVCKTLKKYSHLGVSIPTREEFELTLKKFNQLVSGHKLLLTAIGKL